jgi:hypothetical protein
VVTDDGEETEEEEKTKMTAMTIYIRVTGRREGDTRIGLTMPKRPLAVAGAPRNGSKLAGVGREVAPYRWLEFGLITKMPLKIIPKLL